MKEEECKHEILYRFNSALYDLTKDLKIERNDYVCIDCGYKFSREVRLK